jgi:CheY-like chemotaxis protein
MKILVVEDDHLQSGTLIPQLKERIPGVEITLLETEYSFVGSLPQLRNSPPDVVILDIMLLWDKLSENIATPPEKVETEGTNNAGFRCIEELRRFPETRTIPVVLYSVLDQFDIEEKLQNLPQNVYHIPKDNDYSVLVNLIKRLPKRKYLS